MKIRVKTIYCDILLGIICGGLHIKKDSLDAVYIG